MRLLLCLLVACSWSLPVPEPSEGKDYTTNEGWQLLKNVGDLYLIDLTPSPGQHKQYQPFETSFSRKMTGTDKDTVLLTLSGSDSARDDVFITIMDVMSRRYEARMLKHDNLKDPVKNSEAALWFFLYGAASTTAGQTQSIDEAVGKLLDLAQLAISGKPFYPKTVVFDLMEGSLKKMNPDLSPLMRKLGYIIIEKGVRHQSPGHSSTTVDIHKDDFFVSAEYFQLWTELSVFVFSHMPRENVLLQPMTLVATESLRVVVQNVDLPTGGPLLLHQFEAILGFLEGKRQQLLPANLADARVKADYQAFFAGFCKQQLQKGGGSTDDGSSAAGGRRLFLGKRNVNSAIRAQEFRFLSESFRALQASVAELTSKFTRAEDVGALRNRPDNFSEYDRFDLISETYLAQTNEQVEEEEKFSPTLGEL